MATIEYMPARLTPGSVTLLAVPDEVKHNDFVTQSWVADPLKLALARVPGFARTATTTPLKNPPKSPPDKKR